MPIKTLHLTNAYHSSSGGIRTMYRAMLAAANAEQRPMRLVVPADASRVEAVGNYGRIYHVKAPRSPFIDSRYRLMLPHTFLQSRGSVRRILEEEKPDLVEVCDKYSLCYLAGLLRRGWCETIPRPTLVGLSCERLDDNVAAAISPASLGRRFARWYIGRIYAGQFDYHLANSEYTARELADNMWPKHWRDVHVIPMGVSLDGLGPHGRSEALRADLRRRIGGTTADNITWLLYAGRLSVEKNLSLLVDMLAQLDDARRTWRLVVAGDGPMAAAFRDDAARRAPGRVLMWGHVAARDTLAQLYASCDVFVHPNPHEPFGIAPLEAMASGIPLVAPAAGGLLSYASDGNAWLAEPTGQAFATAVGAACQPGVRRAQRIACARATAARFDWTHVARVIFGVYDALHARRMVPRDAPDALPVRC
ncbi:MAG: glycosyltransferase [Luteitalea sp.]|nr:glycosyltransferase [Luteitalea sp.]